MFPSNFEYVSDNAFENDDEDLSEICDCLQAEQKLWCKHQQFSTL